MIGLDIKEVGGKRGNQLGAVEAWGYVDVSRA
jgi:hypothetical protein